MRKSKLETSNWQDAPISPTCQVIIDDERAQMCGRQTTHVYPAHQRGWMALCSAALGWPEDFSLDDLPPNIARALEKIVTIALAKHEERCSTASQRGEGYVKPNARIRRFLPLYLVRLKRGLAG
jgi:hypothetical protein